MVDLKQPYAEGTNNIRTWRNRYSTEEYPHKIVINMMYRAYNMLYVWQSFQNGELPSFSSFQDAILYMEQFYSQTAANKVQSNLMDWIEDYPSKEIGGITFTGYDKIATNAEFDKKQLEELEFSYLFNLLQDKCVLYWISLRQTGKSQTQSISAITNFVIEEIPNLNYSTAKMVFQQLIVSKYMNDNYTPLP